MAALLNSNEELSVTAECSFLKNGKYRGVVVESLTSRFSVDNFEIHCENERDSKEEAIRDATEFVERRSQGRERRNQ
jgi:hypothetical protein